MTKHTNLETYFEKGITYDQYLENERELLSTDKEFEYREYHQLNLKRMERNNKMAKRLPELTENERAKLSNNKLLIISEGWCGDAAQIVPFAAAIATNAGLELRIVYRDANHELMNEYLTNGGMAIPVIIGLDSNYEYINHFAPRPKEAQELMLDLKNKGMIKDEISIALQNWYNKDKGVKVTQEVISML